MSADIDLTARNSVLMQTADMTFNISHVGSPVQKIEASVGAEQQTMSVYLRMRPFSKEELSDDEDQGCIVIENGQTVALCAPKGSANMKSSEKGIGSSVHKFTFSQIFGPDATQAELFEDTVKSQTSEFLEGKTALLFTYGVTNAGKTYTVQGTPKEPGILPRVLGATFHFIGERQYEGMDLKPYLRNDAQCLDPDQVKQERSVKAAIFASVKEETDHLTSSCGSVSQTYTSRLSASSPSCNQTMAAQFPTEANSSQFALWVAYFEIYNECVYDLFQPAWNSKAKKRASLRVCDDGAGNAYVKDLRWINIQHLGEANKLLHFGNKNRTAAATKMNQSSSRSHSIFTMKLLKIDEGVVKATSEFSLCDLAGSERCNKTKTFGERLKEAGNINNSLLILGKCITALRNNQNDRMKSSYIPFRESKLTKLFQAVFCGKGRASMIVNINQCASTYDETLHVMKFSAIAKQVMQVIPDRSLESISHSLVGRDGKPLVMSGRMDSRALESFLSEEELLEEEDEADMSLLPQNELVNMVESLRAKLLAERKKNLVQEMEIRKEMGDAMLQQLMESEELRTRQIEELKERYQDKLENTFEMYKDAIKEHAYQSARNQLEDDYVPVEEFIAEQQKVEALTRKVSALERSASLTGVASVVPTAPKETGDDLCRWLYKEKCAMERMCEDKQQLILMLEQKVAGLGDSLQKMREDFLEKSNSLEEKTNRLEDLQRKAHDQAKQIEDILKHSFEKDKEIASLKEELACLSQKSPVKSKTRKGLLANIRNAVTSPRTSSGRTLRKTTRNVQ